ncbi:unnamed protein product [Urochloa humidicola]
MAWTADPPSPNLGMATTRVVIDNEASDDTTVIRVVRSVYIPGTLFHSIQLISDRNLVIHQHNFSADASNQFVGVFHVTDEEGNKVLDQATISYIQERLELNRVETKMAKQTMAKEKPHERVAAINALGKDVTFSVSSSLKGGIDVELGCHTVHIPQWCSVRHPVLQMVLFAKVQVTSGVIRFRHRDTFGVAKSILDSIEKSSTDASTTDVQRPVLEAGWVASRKRPAKCNRGLVCTRPGKKPDCKTEWSTDNGSMVPGFMQLHPQSEGSVRLDSVREQELQEHQCRLKNQDTYALVTSQSPTPGGGDWTPAFWLDSGASHHVVADARVLCNLRDPPVGTAVRVADGFRLLVTKVGDIQTEDFKIPDVYLVPGLQVNLISVRQLAKSKIIQTFYENHVELWQEGELVGGAIADDETSLYRLHHLTATRSTAGPTS